MPYRPLADDPEAIRIALDTEGLLACRARAGAAGTGTWNRAGAVQENPGTVLLNAAPFVELVALATTAQPK
jgi:hypothetical protein